MSWLWLSQTCLPLNKFKSVMGEIGVEISVQEFRWPHPNLTRCSAGLRCVTVRGERWAVIYLVMSCHSC